MKRLLRELTPPLLYKTLRRVQKRLTRSRDQGSAGEQAAEYYDCMYQSSNQYRRHYTKFYLYPSWTIIADRLIRSGVNCVLDLGCGPGQFARFLYDKGICRYCGIDFSETCISQARANCPSVEFVQADVFTTELLASYPYDAVICTELLEHVTDDLEIIGRVRPGALFIASVPSYSHESHVRFFNRGDEIERRYGDAFANFTVDSCLLGERGETVFIMQGKKR